jgi:hypothetical protein
MKAFTKTKYGGPEIPQLARVSRRVTVTFFRREAADWWWGFYFIEIGFNFYD